MMSSPAHGRLDTRQRYVYATVWTIVHFLLWVVLIGVALFVVPHSMERFEAFNLELPAITIWVIDASLLVRKYWYAVALLGLVALALDWFVLSTLGKLGRKRMTIVGVLLALLPLLLAAIGDLGMRLPWLSVDGVNGI